MGTDAGSIMLNLLYWQGLGTGASLIMAIGAQNAHVLRMGLQKNHVGITVLVCILGDALLIGLGIAGMGTLIAEQPFLLHLARWGGAAFLLAYGWRAWRSAWTHSGQITHSAASAISRQQALLAILALTFLNPHVYLDTVLMLGMIGGQHAGYGKIWFAAGAMSASLLWFASLGWGARLLAPWFAKPSAWRLLDAGVGSIMWLLAIGLIASALHT